MYFIAGPPKPRRLSTLRRTTRAEMDNSSAATAILFEALCPVES
jgi:hypothetical protein